MDPIKEALEITPKNMPVLTAFGGRLQNSFTLNKSYRRAKEMEWLESLRQYKGLYDPEVKLDPNASKVYPKITRSKVNIVLSRLHEMLFPEIDKNWEIRPTPEPRVSRDVVKKIAMGLVKVDEAGNQTLPTMDELRLAIKKYAEETCRRMESVIDDQFIEMEYPEETKKVLRSGLMYGTGVMKGPTIKKRSKRKWVPLENGDYEEKIDDEDVPSLKFVRIWDWYPDMSTTEISSMEGSFERHVMTKHDLRQLAKRDDFDADLINTFLEEHPAGDYVPLEWEIDLQTIEIEAGSYGTGSASTNTKVTSTTKSVFSQEGTPGTQRQLGKKYEVLEYWGYVDGSDLDACGVRNPDGQPLNSTLEYAANVWLLGRYPIKIALYDKALDQYKVFYYEKDETSIFGEGLARIMRHSQLAISAAARMTLDNAACVAGPQVEVNWHLMTRGADLTSFYSRKIWFREGRGVEAQYPAIRVHNIESHIDELMKIGDAFKGFADEETCLPTWVISQVGANETAQASSGRQSQILVSIKDVVKNFDTFSEGVLRDVYSWNMEFNPREDIKGDYNVKALGVSSLVMKEVRMQALNQLTSTLTPAEWDWIPEGEFVKEKFKGHDLGIRLRTQEEVDKLRQEREMSAMNQISIEYQKSEIMKNKAQAASLLMKAKEHNVTSMKEAQTPIQGEDPRIVEGELAVKQVEAQAKTAEIELKKESHALDEQRKTEKHAQTLAQQADKHRTKKAIDTMKAGTDIAIQQEKAKTDEEIKKEKAKADVSGKKTMTQASAKAKIIQAKKAPAAKPTKKPKEGA